MNLEDIIESIKTEIDTFAHNYNHKIDFVRNTNYWNITAKAKRDALDEALLIIKKYSQIDEKMEIKRS